MIFFPKKNRPTGFSVILPVFILGFVGISVLITLSFSSISALSEIFNHRNAVISEQYLFGCLNEYLVHLTVNPDFSPTSFSIFDTDCTTVVTEPVSGQKQIIISVTNGNIIRQMTVGVSIDPLEILSITEP